MDKDKNSNTYIHLNSSRIVLVEKSNKKLTWTLNFLVRTKYFHTEIIPFKNKILVYQESNKAASFVFGKKKSNIVLARVIILEKILDKRSSVYTEYSHFNISKDICNRHYMRTLFSTGSQYSFSPLVAIPATAKSAFVKYCLNYEKLTYSNSNMELIPVFKIPVGFSWEGIQDGTFLDELNEKKAEKYKHVGEALKSCWAQEIRNFKYYVSLYGEGKWKAFNDERHCNRVLNSL
jgi:hypothetical protein